MLFGADFTDADLSDAKLSGAHLIAFSFGDLRSHVRRLRTCPCMRPSLAGSMQGQLTARADGGPADFASAAPNESSGTREDGAVANRMPTGLPWSRRWPDLRPWETWSRSLARVACCLAPPEQEDPTVVVKDLERAQNTELQQTPPAACQVNLAPGPTLSEA